MNRKRNNFMKEGGHKVLKRGDESVVNMLRRFDNKMETNNLYDDIRKNLYYKKPSDKKREKLNKAKARTRYANKNYKKKK